MALNLGRGARSWGARASRPHFGGRTLPWGRGPGLTWGWRSGSPRGWGPPLNVTGVGWVPSAGPGVGLSGRIQTHLAGGGRASARGSRDSLPLVHLSDKMPGPPAPRWALPFLLPGALSPRTRPSGALHPLAGAPRPPTPRPRSLGRPPYFRLVARGRRHRSEATGLAGPAALKLQLPAGSTQARMRAAGRWRIPRVRERGGACAGVSATLALRMRAVGFAVSGKEAELEQV